MVTLEAAEVEIALLALVRFAQECGQQMSGEASYMPLRASAWLCTKHCREKALALIGRLEQAQQDERMINNAKAE